MNEWKNESLPEQTDDKEDGFPQPRLQGLKRFS